MAFTGSGPLVRTLGLFAVLASTPGGFLSAHEIANKPRASHATTGPTGSWIVRPEWVRAHEEFLASDVLAGRGSATHDEEVTATYVASQFMSYGLKPAPGMTGYLQSAEVLSPVLAGNATLTVGHVTLAEGTDFHLLTSSATAVDGVFQHIPAGTADQATVTPATLALVDGDPDDIRRAMGRLLRKGVGAVLLVESQATRGMAAHVGETTRVDVSLKENLGQRPGPTILVLTSAGAARLAADADGSAAHLTVHVVPHAKPRATFNAIGYLEGSQPESGTVLLTAHLDHLGLGSASGADSIFNGANDDASGTTAVLELAHALAAGPRLKRNIVFVCYGSEELGGLGSTYFGAHPPVPLESIVANLEFEMIGTQDPKMPQGVLLLTGWERSNLGQTLAAHGALMGPDPYPEQHFFERSDNYQLALKGVVAQTAAGWGSPPTYHETNDDLAHLDLQFMTSAIQSLIAPLQWLATSDFKPSWNAGGQPARESDR